MKDPIEYKGLFYDRAALIDYVEKNNGKDLFGNVVNQDLGSIPTDSLVKKICDAALKKEKARLEEI